MADKNKIDFGIEGATYDEVNPFYEGGKSKPENQQGHSNPLATAGVDHPNDKREDFPADE